MIVGGRSLTIVGVTAPGFDGMAPGRSVEITLPLSILAQEEPDFLTRLDSWTSMPLVVRLKRDIDAGQAEAALESAFRVHMAQPETQAFSRSRNGQLRTALLLSAARGQDRLRRDYELPLTVLMEEQIVASLLSERLLATLSATFGALALLLSCVGLYGVISYDVTRRRRDIGIRLALGAPRSVVLAGVLRQAAAIVVAGLAVGFVGAWFTSQLVEGFLFGLSARDPYMFGVAAMTLTITAMLAGYLPARRDARIDPSVMLRAE